MRRLDGYSLVFLFASGVYVGGLYLSESPLRYSGSVAVTALAGLIWSRPLPRDAEPWTKFALLTGLALLAWLLALDDRDGLFAQALTAAMCAAIGLAVLGRAGRLRRWANVPSAVFAVLVVAVTCDLIGDRGVWELPPDIPSRAAAVFFPATTVIMLGLAANAALATRGALRWAGAGLIPLLVLAFGVVPAVLAEDRFKPQTDDRAFSDTSALIDQEAVRAYVNQELVLESIRAYSTSTVESTPPPPPVAVVAGPAIDDIVGDLESHPGPASDAAVLLLGLAAIATSLFPYRR